MNIIPLANPAEEFPGIFIYNGYNPTLYSPNSPYQIMFSQTRESLMDVDLYNNFLYSAIRRFRQSRFYKHYKAHLICDLGIDRCQLHPNITISGEDEMATLEMHHHVLSIFDIALIISEYMLNTYGTINTFDLVELMRIEHEAHRVNTVMLCKTCHQRYTDKEDGFLIPSTLGFGKWWEFLDRYRTGITRDIAVKIYYMLKNDIKNKDIGNKKLLQLLALRDNILKWSDYNEKFYR